MNSVLLLCMLRIIPFKFEWSKNKYFTGVYFSYFLFLVCENLRISSGKYLPPLSYIRGMSLNPQNIDSEPMYLSRIIYLLLLIFPVLEFLSYTISCLNNYVY